MRKPTLEVLEDDVRAMRSAELTLYWYERGLELYMCRT